MTDFRWQRCSDAAAVAEAAVSRILSAAEQAIEARGCFRLVLAGGSTPERVYRRLADCDADWPRWQLYLGDERCLPVDDPERNSRMIEQAWLRHSPLLPAQIHWIPAERGAEQGARDYQSLIEGILPFDMVLLGVGEDGHTASLFPGQWHDPQQLVVPVNDAPKPPPERISLNYSALAQTQAVLVLVTGEGKREAVQRWRAGESLPVAELECECGVDVLIDEATDS